MNSFRSKSLIFASIIVLLGMTTTQCIQAQTYTVLHNFTGGGDGAYPYAGLTIDQGGNLYGTTADYGRGNGKVFKLSRRGSGWVFNPIYTFQGGTDGAQPLARVIIGRDGTLFGTTSQSDHCCGTVFNLKPSPTACSAALCPWRQTVLYRFTGGADGATPGGGDLVFDQSGNIYGTTQFGGAGVGTVYKLTHSMSGWAESVIYSFQTRGGDGFYPYSGVVFDQAGNLYGTTPDGGQSLNPSGTVYKLSPSGSGWTETILHSFDVGVEPAFPGGDLIFDHAGNIYGSASAGASFNGCCGGVFELTPLNGGWTYSILYEFALGSGSDQEDTGPAASLFLDSSGNLYGTTTSDEGGPVYGYGAVFKLVYSNGNWSEIVLHSFNGADGSHPVSNVVMDSSGNLYGTTKEGGANGYGVVWQITP